MKPNTGCVRACMCCQQLISHQNSVRTKNYSNKKKLKNYFHDSHNHSRVLVHHHFLALCYYAKWHFQCLTATQILSCGNNWGLYFRIKHNDSRVVCIGSLSCSFACDCVSVSVFCAAFLFAKFSIHFGSGEVTFNISMTEVILVIRMKRTMMLWL